MGECVSQAPRGGLPPVSRRNSAKRGGVQVFCIIRNALVLVRLQAGSAEAGFLAAFCPIQAVPYLVVIRCVPDIHRSCVHPLTLCCRNGILVANIAAGASEDEFVEAMKKAASPIDQPAVPGPTEGQPPASVDQPPVPVESPAAAPQPSSSSSSSSPSSAQPPDRNAVYEERKARLEAQRAAAEAAERADRLARRRASTTPDPAGRSSNTTYLEQQRRRQQAAQEERARVLRLLENDKIERRQREANRKQALEADSPTKENVPPAPRPTGPETAISFRLLDGSSLKAKFPSSAVLGADVRQWLDANRSDGDQPYSFLQILAPRPNKPLSISDESSALCELGLSPTATLVLVPEAAYTTAYKGGGTSNEVGLLARAYGMVYGAVATVLGVGYPVPVVPAAVPERVQRPVQSRPGTAGGAPMSRTNSGSGSGRIRTLYDQREGEGGGEDKERKYYNGNQVCGAFLLGEGSANCVAGF